MFALEFRYVGMKNWVLGPSMPGVISIIPLMAVAIWFIAKKKDEMHIDYTVENLGK